MGLGWVVQLEVRIVLMGMLPVGWVFDAAGGCGLL